MNIDLLNLIIKEVKVAHEEELNREKDAKEFYINYFNKYRNCLTAPKMSDTIYEYFKNYLYNLPDDYNKVDKDILRFIDNEIYIEQLLDSTMNVDEYNKIKDLFGLIGNEIKDMNEKV